MKISLMHVCHRVPVFRPVAKTLPPQWLLHWTRSSAYLSSFCHPHARKKLRAFLEVHRSRYSGAELRRRGRRYLYCLRLSKELLPAWANWHHRSQDWTDLTGEENLRDALSRGQGAVLISGHSYGFSRFLAPLLAQKGYRVTHGGGGGRGNDFRIQRWGSPDLIQWRYISYGFGRWDHLKVVNTMSKAIARNEIVYLSIRGLPMGEPEMELDFWYGRFFLESVWFRVFERWQAPVLPFFVIEDGRQRLRAAIHPAISGGRFAIAKGFARHYLSYLKEFPECGRMWRDIYLGRPFW